MTISRKLVLTMLGVAITPLCIGLYCVNQIVVRQTEQLVGTRLQDSIEQTARAIDQFMLEAKRSMHDFVDDALDHRDDSALLSKKLRARTYTHPVFNELDFVDPSGKIVASSNTCNIGRNILDGLEQVRTDFEEAKADLYSKVYVADSNDFTKRPAVTQGSQGRAPIDVPIVMIAGVRDQTGSLQGLVVGRIQFGGIRNLVTECNQRTPGIVATTLVDHDGGVLVSSNFKHKQFELVPEFSDRSFQRRATSSSGWMMRLDSENKRVMTGYAQLQDYCADKEGGWTLLTNASYSVMMAPFGGAMANLFTAFVPMLVVVGIMGYLLSRSLSKPLLKLAETARALSSGDYSARVACGSNDETGLVAKTFNQMAEQVQRDRTSVRNEMDERLKAEEGRNRFFTLSLDLLCIVDSDGKFVRTSPSFEAVLGWSSAEVSGQSFLDFVHREDVEDSLSEFRALQLGSSTYNFENRYLTKDGGHRWISWNAVFFPGGMIYAAGRDITEQKAARVELTQAKDSAEKASKAKDEFLSHMSHELRTPLNAVIGFAQLLQIQSDDRDTLDSAESILKGGRHLLALVNEVLDLAKIESGNMTVSLEPVPLMDAVRQSMDLVKPIADERDISMTLVPGSEDEIFVKADRQRLIQVLLNILTNASRYNRAGGKIEVKCSIADNGTVRIAITDTGFGIKESVGHKLFQPFERLGETTVDGTGLGLALSRRLMRLMNGELSLEQTSESGSTFTVEVGHAQRPAPIRLEKECESKLASGADNRTRVVYIDDNFSNVHLLERVFEKVGGVELLSAMQASIGIQLIEEHMPDLVLLDLHLPDMSGLEALRILRSNPATAQIPVIMVSADATDGQIRTLLEAGAKAYLTKPIDIGTLFSQVTAARAS